MLVGVLVVDRSQVLAHRVAVQALLRDRPPERVLRLGVQSTGPSVALALAARTDAGHADLVSAWTHRGAPHRQRADDLAVPAAASLPFDDADAAARMHWSRPQQAALGMGAREAIDRAADALAAVVTAPMTKGAVSAAITRLLPAPLLRDCVPCGCVHVHEQLMRLAALPAGVGLDASGPTLLLAPGGWARPAAPDVDAAAALVEAYLRVLGPATDRQVADFLGTTPTAFTPALAAAGEGLEEVEVTGFGRARLPAGDVAALANPPEPDAVRLLPPFDPFVQARDRELVIDDPSLRKEVHRVIGNPGIVLADGEVVATWRATTRAAKRSRVSDEPSGRRLTLLVSPAVPLPPPVRSRIDDEAERVAAARGLTLAGVTVG